MNALDHLEQDHPPLPPLLFVIIMIIIISSASHCKACGVPGWW
jgi:hypothetical protein